MPNGIDIGCETLSRLVRQGCVIEAEQYLREQFINLQHTSDFAELFLNTFLPAVVRCGEKDMTKYADVICRSWLVADSLKLYPDEPWMGSLLRLLLPATDQARGLQAAITLASKSPHLPQAEEYQRRVLLRHQDNRKESGQDSPVIRMERHIAITDYRMDEWISSASGSCRRTLLRSPQERELIKAARAYFVGQEVIPNVPLRNFIDLGALKSKAPSNVSRYALLAEVDVLVATPVEFDPVGVIELDSGIHDAAAAKRRDEKKNRILIEAGIPIVRIRPLPTHSIHASDLYNLLEEQSHKFANFRPHVWRDREDQQHRKLVPAA